MRSNKFIAIEGLDGSGKSTQLQFLTEYFDKLGIQTRFIHFPRSSEGYYGDLIAKFLRGEFGNVNDVHPQLVALLFAMDRKDFSEQLKQWLNDGFSVLVDRYVLSNIAFQCAKLNNENEKTDLANWINNFEFEYNQIPRPDLSVFLDVPFSFTQKSLLKNRTGTGREYLNGKEDIHEKDLDLQTRVAAEYDKMANAGNKIVRISCCNESGNMRSKEEIHAEIIERAGLLIK